MLLRQYPNGTCWICGSNTALTREHKFKASDLRRHFGIGTLIVRSGGDDTSQWRTAQGVKSRHLKYESTICEACNSFVTQESDHAYDELITEIERTGPNEIEIAKVFSSPKFRRGSKLYIPLFRFFAKQIGCHLRDIGAPVPVHLSRFVAKKNEKNCIWLQVQQDAEYRRTTIQFGIYNLKYAAHGGLVIITKEPKFLPVRLHTTMTIGPIQFVFVYVYTIFEILEMRLRYPGFIKFCADQAQAMKDNPISQAELEKLGLS